METKPVCRLLASAVKTSNRTIVEWKPDNCKHVAKFRASFTSNRTIVEWKHAKAGRAHALPDTSNRTIVEWKHRLSVTYAANGVYF